MACYTSNEMQFTSKNAQAKRTGNHIDTVLFVKYLTVYSGYLPEKQHVDGKIFHQPCFFDKNAPMEYESESLGYCDAHLEGGGMLMSIARGEKETIIRRDVEGLHAWSNVPADIRELKEKGWTLIREDMWGATFTAPDHAIRILPAVRQKRPLTERQRQALASHAFTRQQRDTNAQTQAVRDSIQPDTGSTDTRDMIARQTAQNPS